MIYFDGILWSWQTGGGVYRYFQKLISSVAKKGLPATFVLQEPVIGSVSEQSESFRVVRLGSFGSSLKKLFASTARRLFSPLNKIFTEKYFTGIKSGVFHSTYYTTYKSLKIPQILTVHDMTYEKFPEFFSDSGSKRFIANKKTCIEKADAIICVSESTKKSLKDMYGVPDEKIRVIYHGVEDYFNDNCDRELAKKLIVNNSLFKPFLLFVGNRGKYKNFDFLIESFSSWDKRNEYDIVVLGGGKFTADEEKLIKNLNIGKSIKKLGYVSEEELKTFYCLSKAFVFPSLDEGFGLPILEAISCGTRVLASNISAFKEIGHDIPLFFDPTSPASFIKTLDQISFLPALSPVEKAKNAKTIKDAFSWEKCVEETIEVYKTFLQK